MINWHDLKECPREVLPGHLERVLVYNGLHLFDIAWREILRDQMMKYPVTHFYRYNVPYPQRSNRVLLDDDYVTRSMRQILEK